MNLLVVTQTVDRNDHVLGFFHAWLSALAERVGSLTVLALSVGDHALPENVAVVSIGAPGKNRLLRSARVIRESVARRHAYDAVLVHMNPEYVVLAGILWRLLGKRIGLWYTHRAVTSKLWLAEKLAHVVFTAVPESFRLPSDKLHVLGHGIDTASFACRKRLSAQGFRIVSVGRITPIKRCEVLIEAAAKLKAAGRRFSVMFIGAPAVPSDVAYAASLRELVRRKHLDDVVSFAGPVSYPRMGEVYCGSDASVNLTPTGGIDKAVLESMAAGTATFSSNKAFEPYFGAHAPSLIFADRDADDLAAKLDAFFRMPAAARRSLGAGLAAVAREKADVARVTNRILTFLVSPL